MKNITLNRVLSASYLKDEINSLYENGMPEGMKVGIESIDNIFRLDTGMVAIITGIPNYGKSEFIDFVNVRLNEKYQHKTVYFSPENMPVKLHLAKLIRKIGNKRFVAFSKEEINKYTDYIVQNFFFLNYEAVNTLDDILSCTEDLIVSEGVKVLVIDAYNTLEDSRPNNLTETEYVSQVMMKLQKFAKRHDILIEMVVHPKKMQSDSDGNTMIPGRYDLNGSANFVNKSDYIIVVHRDFEANTTIIKCDKCKFSNYGQIGYTEVKYDVASGNYKEMVYTDDMEELNASIESAFSNQILMGQMMKENYLETDKKNVLDVTVSFFEHTMVKKGKVVNLYEYLMDENGYYKSTYQNVVDYIRSGKDDDEIKQLKTESKVPSVTISCVCGQSKDDIEKQNSLICIDIDKKDNLLMIDKVPDILRSIRNVAYFSKSISGNGYFAIIPIRDRRKFKLHFNALRRTFEQFGITIDKSCSNINRLRYYSYPDGDTYINPYADVYTDIYEIPTKVDKDYGEISINDKRINDMMQYVKDHKLDITETYDDWTKVAMSIANTFGEGGVCLFVRFCENNKNFDEAECREKYMQFVDTEYDYTIGTLFYIFEEYKRKKGN